MSVGKDSRHFEMKCFGFSVRLKVADKLKD